MDRLLVKIPLPYKNTGSLRIHRIVFHHCPVENTGHDIPGQYVVLRHFFITVVRYPYLPNPNQSTNPVEGHTHIGSLACVLSAGQVQMVKQVIAIRRICSRGRHSGSGMNSVSPGTGAKRPAFQSAFACSMRS
jgi:hypothetical protein